MSFTNKFKSGTSNPSDVPAGVNMEHTSFGYNQNKMPYMKPQLQQNAPVTKTKPRGGWDDDDDDDVPQLRGASGGAYKGNQTTQQANTIKSPGSSVSNKSDDLAFVPSSKKTNPTVEYEIMSMDEQFIQAHEYENNMINELIQPGGARLKQPDASLNNFAKACESFQTPVVGSLLISKLYEGIPYVSRARLLFAIEAAVRKVKKFYEYFKHNLNVLRELDFSYEGPNAAALTKIRDDIVKYIEEPNKPKQPIIPATNSATLSYNNSSAYDNNDLLGPSQPQGKADPFAFIKKSASDKTPQSQSSTSQNFELLDIGSEPQGFPSQQQQPFVSQSQPFSQAQPQQPKKFNPFDIPGAPANTAQPTQSTHKASFDLLGGPVPTSQPTQPTNKASFDLLGGPIPTTITQPTQPITQTTAKPSGLPGNFKKFQNAAPSNQTTAPVQNNMGFGNNAPSSNNQNLLGGPSNNAHKPTSNLDQLDDLLDSFSGIDFGAQNAETQAPSSKQGPGATQAQHGAQNSGYANDQVHRFAANYNPSANQPQGQANKPTPTPSTQTQPNPQYGGHGPYPGGAGAYPGPHGAYAGGPGPQGGFQGYGANMNRGYPPAPQQGYPGYNYPPQQGGNYGYGQPQQPQYGAGNYGHPAPNMGGNMPQGQYGGAPYQGQGNMPGYNQYQGQPGKK